MKKHLSLLLVLCMVFCFSTNVYAMETFESEDVLIEHILNADLTKMTKDELNSYINQIEHLCKTYEFDKTSTYSANAEVPGLVGQAWLAAAEIARGEGYVCAAIAVECSVNNVNLSETTHHVYGDGPFLKKLKLTSVYQSYLNSLFLSGKVREEGSFEITKSDDSDLFYALHNVRTAASGMSIGTPLASYIITISDVFDFALDNDYDDLFTTLVNNWAWLCQQTHVLHPITITLSTYA